MKKITTLTIIGLLLTNIYVSAQDSTAVTVENKPFAPSGKVSATIYTSATTSAINDTITGAGFAVERAYLGYTYQATKEFSTEVKLDVGGPADVYGASLTKRFMYLRTAYGKYEFEKGSIIFGMFDVTTIELQQNTWGNRYIYRTFLDQHKFAEAADLGVGAKYKLTNEFILDGSIYNGEGFTRLQSDMDFVYQAGATFIPSQEITLRVSGDYSNLKYAPVTVCGFISVKPIQELTVSGEYNLKYNNAGNKNNDLQGISGYATYAVNKQVKIYARYDKLWSNTLDGTVNPWNLNKDGQAVIGGVEYSPFKNLKFAANYTGWINDNTSIQNKDIYGIYAEIKF